MSLIYTFILYVFVYVTATLIFKSADNTRNNTRKKIILVCGVFFLAMFACVRNINIGTDTSATILLYFVNPYENSVNYINSSGGIDRNILYFAISDVIHFFHLGTKTFLFILEICILMPVVLSAYILRDRIPMHIIMLLFLLFYYQIGFNWIRQSIASAFTLLTLVYFQKKCLFGIVITTMFAILFHPAAIIGLTFLLFTHMLMQLENQYLQFILGICLIMLLFLSLFMWEKIFFLGINNGILPSSYSGYLRVFSGQTTVENWFLVGKRTCVDYLLRIIVAVTPFFILQNKMPIYIRKDINYYKIISLIALTIYTYIFLGMHSPYGNRIVYSVDYIQILNLGMCCAQSYKYKVAVIAIAVFYNVWLYYVLGWHDTVPFVFG